MHKRINPTLPPEKLNKSLIIHSLNPKTKKVKRIFAFGNFKKFLNKFALLILIKILINSFTSLMQI